MEIKTGKEMAEELTSFVNVFGVDEKGFAERIASSHKTLQQSTMRLFVEMCRAIAANEKYTDDRNAAATQLAKRVVEAADEIPLPFI